MLDWMSKQFKQADKKSIAEVESDVKLNNFVKEIGEKLGAKYHCIVDYTFFVHLSISPRINALTYTIKNYVEKDSGDLMHFVQNEFEYIYNELNKNARLDTMIKFLKIESKDNGNDCELSMPRTTFDELIKDKKIVEQFIDHYNKKENEQCFKLMVDTLQKQIQFTDFNELINKVYDNKGTVKASVLKKYNVREYTSDDGGGIMAEIYYDFSFDKKDREGIFKFILENKKLNGILSLEF